MCLSIETGGFLGNLGTDRYLGCAPEMCVGRHINKHPKLFQGEPWNMPIHLLAVSWEAWQRHWASSMRVPLCTLAQENSE